MAAKKGKQYGKIRINVTISDRQNEMLEAIDPIYGRSKSDRLLYCFQRFIEENSEGIWIPEEDAADPETEEAEE